MTRPDPPTYGIFHMFRSFFFESFPKRELERPRDSKRRDMELFRQLVYRQTVTIATENSYEIAEMMVEEI